MPGSFNDLLDGILTEGTNLATQENANRATGLARRRRALFENSGPTVGEDELSTMFSQQAGKAAQDSNEAFSQARAGLGEAGIMGGGYARAVGSDIVLRRMGQLTGARSNLRLYKAQADAQDRINKIRNEFAIADAEAEGPSMIRQDSLEDVAGGVLGMEGVQAGERASERADRTSRRNGILGLIGSVL